MSTALTSLVDDEVDDLTPLPQGIHSHSQSGGRINARPPLTRISSSDKVQSAKSPARGKNFVSGRKSDTQEQIEGPEGSQHIVFRYQILQYFVKSHEEFRKSWD